MKLNLLILAILVFYQHPVLADIVTDGSVGNANNIGRAQPINPTNNGQITINQDLGSLEGNNLFHSFQQFDIKTNETATFTGDDTIQNVISRVTGGNKSHINGILRSEVGSAEFYFINPAGVVFKENSQVDVPASFHISTAGELIFADADGSSFSFSALNPEASTLTAATPDAFGFTSGQNGSLKIIGGQLKFKPGTNVSLSANSLNIQNADITETRSGPDFGFRHGFLRPGLHLNLAVIDSSTTRNIPIIDLANTSATGGELTIENSTITVQGNGSGRLAIRAGTMTVTGSKSDVIASGLFAENLGAEDAGVKDGISIDVNSLDLKDAWISSSTISGGDGGKIEIKAEQLKISGISGKIFSGTEENGIAGKITVTVSGAIQIINEGKISPEVPGPGIFSETAGLGNGGIINVTAGQLTIDGQGSQISSRAFDEFKSNAGSITIEVANTIQLLNHVQINTSAVGGNGGNISLESGRWSQLQNAEITTSVESPDANSTAGNIIISVPVLILDTAKILAETKSEKVSEGNVDTRATLLVASEDSFNIPDSINIILAATSGELIITSPELNIVGALAGVITPNLETERLSQDPCAHGDENSLKSLGHGGAPAFQHGENYLPINRFEESDHEPEDMGTLQNTSPINAVLGNIATECAKSQRTSLN